MSPTTRRRSGATSELTAVTMVFTLATFAAILLLIGLIVVLPTVLQLIGLGTAAQWAARAGGLVLMLLLMLAGLAALYRFGPSRHAAQWRWRDHPGCCSGDGCHPCDLGSVHLVRRVVSIV